MAGRMKQQQNKTCNYFFVSKLALLYNLILRLWGLLFEQTAQITAHNDKYKIKSFF